MKKIKFIKEKKQSIFGIILAFILLFSFNYSPISLISMSISKNKKTSAYSSSTTQTYYGDDGVKQESNVNAGLYADGTSSYFTGSSNNYNILKNYSERYNKLFNQYINEFLEAQDKDKNSKYFGEYSLYLEFLNQKSLSSYYEANSSASLSSYTSFREYFEYFVTTESPFTVEKTETKFDEEKNDNVTTTINEEHTLPALFSKGAGGELYKANIYNSIANFLENNQIAVEGNDGLADDNDDFYAKSVSFKRVKTFIDKKIEETTVITNYDGSSQDDHVAAIIANKAPVVQGYYFDKDDLLENKRTDFNYKKETYTNNGITFSMPRVYYFGNETELSNNESYRSFKDKGYKVDTSYAISELESNALYYRPIQHGEFGYFEEKQTYYAYEKVPYDMTNSVYELYVVNDNPSISEQATYDSLYYVHVISNTELNKGTEDRLETNKDGYKDTSNYTYVQVPYLAGSVNYANVYFSKLFSTISTNDFNRIVNLFKDSENRSKLFFKISSSSYTSSKKVVYIDPSQTSLEDFKANNPNFSLPVEELKLGEDANDDQTKQYPITMKDYQLIESTDSPYIKGYSLYYKKNRTYFKTTTTNYSGYVTESTPNVEFEKTTVASKKYEKDSEGNKNVYVLVDNLEIDGVKYPTVSKDVIEKQTSHYDEVTDKTLNSNYKFYYKHTIGENGNPNLNEFETLNNEKVIYVYTVDVKVGETSYTAISKQSLDIIRNLYSKVPSTVSKEINGESNSYDVYYKHTTEEVKQIYIIDDTDNAKDNQVYKNLNYKVFTSKDYKETYFKYVELETIDSNYNKNFKLYYKLSTNFENKDAYISNSNLFVQNQITGRNAVYIVDDSLTSTDKASYKSLYYTTITTDELKQNSEFYVLINENDDNYSKTYTKLYYKYTNTAQSDKKIYVYSKDESLLYESFYSTDVNYDKNAYELIEPYKKDGSKDENYVPGLELYYKKLVSGEPTPTYYEENSYYYFKTSSSVELKANSYYNISFYAYTNSNYVDENNNTVVDENNKVTASFYIKDNDKVISDVSIENISTDGKWVQYNAFIATDAITPSKIYMYMYLGTEDSIAGSTNQTEVSGTVMFDNIKITLIGETDYNNQTIDNKPVQQEIKEYNTVTKDFPIVTQANIDEIAERYVKLDDLQVAEDMLLDEEYDYYYKHNIDSDNKVLPSFEEKDNSKVIYVYQGVNDSTATVLPIKVITKTHLFENVDEYKNPVFLAAETIATGEENKNLIAIGENEKLNNRITNSSIISDWNENFNLDSSATLNNRLSNLTFVDGQDGFTSHSDWHYYISREHSGQGNNDILKAYQQAYTDKKVSISVVEESTIDKTIKEEDKKEEDKEEDKKEEDNKEEDKKEEDNKNDVPTIDSTFISNNQVIKIENKDRLKSLGIASNTFTVKQNEYYKVTVWIYSPKKESTATIKLESILYTAGTTNQGSLVSASNSKVSAYLADYTTKPTNEYSWIPVSFYIEGNAYHNQDVNVVLLADADSTVYFDNITIEKVNSTTYDKANSDSENLTTCLALSPSKSVFNKGITNGYFNLMTLTTDYVDVDYTKPFDVESWTKSKTASQNVIAGVVPTSQDYWNNSNNDNFYTKYNKAESEKDIEVSKVPTNGFDSNLFAIYAPDKAKASIHGEDGKEYNVTNNYAIYSSSTSLSSGTLYEMSFEFYAGYNFKGNMIANLYSSSVSDANILTNFKVSSDDLQEGWNKFTFYIMGGSASTNVYIEIGVEDAVGTCFFQKVTNATSTYKSIDEARDAIVDASENVETSTDSIYNYPSLSNYQFINLGDYNFSIHSNKEENGVFNSSNYTNTSVNTSGYTVGATGTVVANYYSKTTSTHYTAEIKDVLFLKSEKENTYTSETDADNIFYIKEVKEGETTTFKLYSDSMFTVEVAGFDLNKNKKADNNELGNYTITKNGSTVKITFNDTDTTTTTVNKNNYTYNFNNDIELNNQVIPGSELNNNYSQNVLILSNGYTTDYTVVSPRLLDSVAKSSFYVLKIYVKTSEIVAKNGESGLNISVDAVTVNWNNIDTTKSKNADENGFVCYELWLKTNTSSYSEFKVKFSLGSEKSPCSGYAIIAGISLEKLANETLFNEYCEANEELYKENDSSSIAKRFYGTEEVKKDETTEEEDEDSSIWATFFYIFSSLLLGIVLIIALVAIFIKKHPIKSSKHKVEGDIIVVNPNKVDTKVKEKEDKKKAKYEANKNVSLDTTTEETPATVEETNEETPATVEETTVETNDESSNEESITDSNETPTEETEEASAETAETKNSNGDEGFL